MAAAKTPARKNYFSRLAAHQVTGPKVRRAAKDLLHRLFFRRLRLLFVKNFRHIGGRLRLFPFLFFFLPDLEKVPFSFSLRLSLFFNFAKSRTNLEGALLCCSGMAFCSGFFLKNIIYIISS